MRMMMTTAITMMMMVDEGMELEWATSVVASITKT